MSYKKRSWLVNAGMKQNDTVAFMNERRRITVFASHRVHPGEARELTKPPTVVLLVARALPSLLL